MNISTGIQNNTIIKKIFHLLTLVMLPAMVLGQNGKILERKTINPLTDEGLKRRLLDSKTNQLKKEFTYLDSVVIEDITYMSDGHKVKGYLAYPKKSGVYPAVVYNRGGNLDFGALNLYKATFILGRLAAWNYFVIGSQYRGNAGGVGGRDEFGGAEVNDILNLVPLLENESLADASKLGLYGWSRGGMMTYLTLMKNNEFKAAVVGGGLSDLHKMKETRPVMEEVYEDLIPGYVENKEKLLDERSAIKFADKLPKTIPILLLHGTSDWRVVPQMALNLSEVFISARIPHRLVLFEGGDHGLNEFDDEVDIMVKQWFDKYLKNDEPLPNLEPHGK